MGLDITDIEHPEFIHTMLISGLQLLPHLGDMRHGEPLAGSRRTIIAYMIIHTIAALVEIFLSIRKSAHMTEVVIAKHHDDIIGHLESLVIIIEHLTVECPDLWGLGGWFPGDISYDFSLFRNDLFHQPEVSLSTTCIGHRTIFVTSHTDGHELVVTLAILDSLSEETFDGILVGQPVPFTVAIVLLMSNPLLLRALHRLMVRGTHHDAILISQSGILRIILIEAVALIQSVLILQDRYQRLVFLERAPHGRPEAVCLEAKEEFEDMGIHLAVHAPKLISSPGGHTRELIIDEETTIFHLRLSTLHRAWLGKDLLMLGYRRIRPPIPRRHPHLSGNLVNAIDGATHIATCHHQGTLHTLGRMINGLDDKALPLALERTLWQDAFLGKASNCFTHSVCANEDGITHHILALAAHSG